MADRGEQFDPTGLKITATYSDKSTKAIDPTDEAVTYHYDFAKPSGATKITVTYDGQTASFTVKVTATMPETKPATTPSSRHRRCKTATPRRSRTACPTRCPRPTPARLRSSPWRHSHC
ncbi:MAG: bacterial Ig-like domain-containing protein [Bifidobacterium longum]